MEFGGEDHSLDRDTVWSAGFFQREKMVGDGRPIDGSILQSPRPVQFQAVAEFIEERRWNCHGFARPIYHGNEEIRRQTVLMGFMGSERSTVFPSEIAVLPFSVGHFLREFPVSLQNGFRHKGMEIIAAKQTSQGSKRFEIIAGAGQGDAALELAAAPGAVGDRGRLAVGRRGNLQSEEGAEK